MWSEDPEVLACQQIIQSISKENLKLKQTIETKHAHDDVYFRLHESGAVAIFGVSKYPVIMFAEQIYRLLDKGEDLRAFIKENKDDLSWMNRGTKTVLGDYIKK